MIKVQKETIHAKMKWSKLRIKNVCMCKNAKMNSQFLSCVLWLCCSSESHYCTTVLEAADIEMR